jgi:hypothetical protein
MSENYLFSRPADYDGGFNQFAFVIDQKLAKLNTCALVKVTRVTGAGVALTGFVDCMPLVSLIDGKGNAYDNPELHNVPYFRVQGGTNAVIVDPEVGDIGLVCYASRDISGVKNALKAGPPSSARQFDLGDALYFGGFRNAAPTRYIQFTSSGIKIHGVGSADTITLENIGNVNVNASTKMTVNCDTQINGNLTVSSKTTTGTLQVL